MPNSATLLGVRRDGDEVLRDRRLVRAEPAEQPVARACAAFVSVSIVVNVFEETTKSVEAGSRSRVASAKSVPSTFETNRYAMFAVGCTRRARASPSPGRGRDPPMPMLTTARIALAGVAAPVAAADPRRRSAAMRSSTSCTFGTTSSPSTSIDGAARRPQRDVQHGAVLGRVDALAAEHRFDPRRHAALLGERDQQAASSRR